MNYNSYNGLTYSFPPPIAVLASLLEASAVLARNSNFRRQEPGLQSLGFQICLRSLDLGMIQGISEFN